MDKKLRLGIGCDHAGFTYKEELIKLLKNEGYEVTDFGTHSEQSVDYPDYVHPLCNAIETGKDDLGILLCGSANGVAITANKHQHIRAAICWIMNWQALPAGIIMLMLFAYLPVLWRWN